MSVSNRSIIKPISDNYHGVSKIDNPD